MFDFLGSGNEEREEAVEFDEFDEWFREELRELDGFTWSDVEGKYEEIESIVDEMRENLDRLRNAELTEEIAPRLKKAGESNKKILLERLQSFVDRFETLESDGYKQAYRFLKEKTNEIESVSEKVGKSVKFVQKIHGDETRALMDSLRDFEETVEPPQRLKKAADVLSSYESVSELREDLEKKRGEIEELQERLDEEIKEKEKLEEEIEELEDSEKSEDINERKEDIDGFRSEIQQIKNKILGRISPLKRGFKKLKYFGFLSERKEMLSKYIQSPVEAVKEDEDLSFLQEAVEKLEESLSSGELDFSDDEAERLREELDKTSIEEIKEFLERWRNLEEKIHEAEDLIEDMKMDNRRSEIKSKIERKADDIEDLRSRITKEEDRIKNLQESVEETKEEIQKKVKEVLNVNLELKGI